MYETTYCFVFSLACAVCLSASAVAGEWVQAAEMNQTRQYPGLARLPDGRILAVTGHPLGGKSLASAEIYDPDHDRWTATGSLAVPRNGVQPGGLIVLANHKVLICGSGSGSRSVHEAELFDPATQTWSPTGSMSVPRCVHTSTLLDDGRVLVTGGIDWSTNEVHATAETFDPVRGQWNPAGKMKVARWNHRALRLHDGRVLVIGGASSESGAGDVLAEAEIFDPKTGTWSAASPMRQARRALGAVVLSDGRALVVGGKSAKSAPLAECELYDPASNQWSVAPPLNEARWGPSVSLLGNGNVLVVAGMSGRFGRSSSAELSSAELLDSKHGKWISAGQLQTRRNGHRAITLDDGSVLIVGGFSGISYLSSCERYVP